MGLMDLAFALRAGRGVRLAVVGAGGKTSALFQLARQLPPPVWVSASTHLGSEQVRLGDRHLILRSPADIPASLHNLEIPASGVTVFSGPPIEQGRVSGLDEETLAVLHIAAEAASLPLLIEADGSRRLPLKAPAEHEPAIPPWVNLVLVVAGLSGLGNPLDENWVHRPQLFARLSGLNLGDEITPQALLRVLTHPAGGLKNIPPGARRVLMFNQADTSESRKKVEPLANALLRDYQAVLVASLNPPIGDGPHPSAQGGVYTVHEPVAGIILAAGGSRRLDQPKQLLHWKGLPLVRHVAQTALQASLDPVIVVTGAYTQQVENALSGLPVKFAFNPDWERGQSSSIQEGLRQLPEAMGAAIFLLSDQPQVPVGLLEALIDAHSRSLAPLVAPQVGSQRANPVLFDRVTFPDLLTLEGDVGGRGIFKRHALTLLPWEDERLLLDVDTLEDYQRLLEL